VSGPDTTDPAVTSEPVYSGCSVTTAQAAPDNYSSTGPLMPTMLPPHDSRAHLRTCLRPPPTLVTACSRRASKHARVVEACAIVQVTYSRVCLQQRPVYAGGAVSGAKRPTTVLRTRLLADHGTLAWRPRRSAVTRVRDRLVGVAPTTTQVEAFPCGYRRRAFPMSGVELRISKPVSHACQPLLTDPVLRRESYSF